MTEPACASNFIAQKLLLWRNPGAVWHTSPILGLNRCVRIQNEFLYRKNLQYGGVAHFLRVGATEAMLCLALTVAMIDTVFQALFSGISILLYPLTDRPFRFFAEALESSSFTTVWIVFLVYLNLSRGDPPIHESDARLYLKNEIGIDMVRQKDLLRNAFVYDEVLGALVVVRQVQEALDEVMAEKDENHPLLEKISTGLSFLLNDILGDVDEATKKEFPSCDPSMFEFVCAKTLFLYSKGSKQQEPIPSFLTETTAKEIQKLREDETITLSEDLSSAFTSLSKFGQSAELVKPFKHLGEYQNSVLLTQCWARAIKALLKAA